MTVYDFMSSWHTYHLYINSAIAYVQFYKLRI